MKRELVLTSDGSHSLFVPELNEHYHSVHGALQESQYVFIQKGLEFFPSSKKLSILEVGLGTGLNLWLTFLAARDREATIAYTGLEAFPLSDAEWEPLNYAQQLGKAAPEFTMLHRLPWNEQVEVEGGFEVLKQIGTLQLTPLGGPFDLVYFDAFAPSVQPELWELPVLQRVVEALAPGGLFVTYCAKGQLRRDLQTLGLQVERLPGPPGKREMLRAIRPML